MVKPITDTGCEKYKNWDNQTQCMNRIAKQVQLKNKLISRRTGYDPVSKALGKVEQQKIIREKLTQLIHYNDNN